MNIAGAIGLVGLVWVALCLLVAFVWLFRFAVRPLSEEQRCLRHSSRALKASITGFVMVGIALVYAAGSCLL